MSGFALFVVLYLFNASTFLIDKNVFDWAQHGGTGAAIAAALGALVLGWLVYDQICRRFGHAKDGSIGNDGLVLGLQAVYLAAAIWVLCHLFAGRAAFLISGAMIATMMSANVFFWIIPGQKTVIADMRAGRPVDAIHGQRGKQRSVHNTYFGLPVLIAMLSNHYGMLYSHANNWLVLVLLMLAGVLIRTWFVQRHKGGEDWKLIAGALVLLGVLIAWLAPARAPEGPSAPPAPTLAQVEAVVNQRCVLCHNAQLNQKGIMLHTPELIEKNAAAMYQQAVVQKTMPLKQCDADHRGRTGADRALVPGPGAEIALKPASGPRPAAGRASGRSRSSRASTSI